MKKKNLMHIQQHGRNMHSAQYTSFNRNINVKLKSQKKKRTEMIAKSIRCFMGIRGIVL